MDQLNKYRFNVSLHNPRRCSSCSSSENISKLKFCEDYKFSEGVVLRIQVSHSYTCFFKNVIILPILHHNESINSNVLNTSKRYMIYMAVKLNSF